MRYLSGIKLTSVIMHILDSKNSTEPLLSPRVARFQAGDRVGDYFAEHIQKSLRDGRTIAATFRNVDVDSVGGTLGGILDGSTDLVDGSQRIARRLFEIMAKNHSIKPGDLAVCTFTAASTPNVSYLALLKLDPGFTLALRTLQTSVGYAEVDFEVNENVLPPTGEPLQKCAFVHPEELRGQFDLMVLDDQNQRKPGQPVAAFFLDEFLDARPAFDDPTRTRSFVRALKEAERQTRGSLTPEQRNDFRALAGAVVRQSRVNLDTWVESLPLPDNAKQSVDRVLQRQLVDRDFPLVATVVDQLVPRRRFRGQGGLRVDVPRDLYDVIVRDVSQQFDENNRPYIRVVLHTDTWQEE